jgi:hypothetical protein
MAPALRMTRSIKEKLPIFFFDFHFFLISFILIVRQSLVLLFASFFLILASGISENKRVLEVLRDSSLIAGCRLGSMSLGLPRVGYFRACDPAEGPSSLGLRLSPLSTYARSVLIFYRF